MSRAVTDLCVLDTLANDLESLADMLRLLNHPAVGWRDLNGEAPFGREQVVPALLRRIRDDLVEACVAAPGGALVGIDGPPDGSLHACWFRLTARGRIVHANWTPPGAAASVGAT
jgi:hypothetical protein